MKFINDLINNAPFSATPVGHAINIGVMVFMGICILALVVCGIVLMYTIIITARRNARVYKIRSWMIDNYHQLYRFLPPYDNMMKGWYKVETWKKKYWLDYAIRVSNTYETNSRN